tara:strand:- start:195 stop:401 length:207 start_codon:yes stop_codon:yes gene_type:complete
MSKGDKPRPLSVSYDEYSRKWDDIFGKKDTTKDITLSEDEEREAEARIDVIGKNGNDGLHYEQVDGES